MHKINFEKNKGFTLLELLVVIAVIGILAAIVISALGSAKTKSNDAAISSIMSSMRAQAALYHSAIGNYGTSAGSAATHCLTASTMFVSGAVPNLSSLLGDLARKNGSTLGTSGAGKNVICSTLNAPATAWAIVASTTGSATIDWCADSSGASKAVSGGGEIVAATGLCK